MAGSRARLSAARVGGGVVSVKFRVVVASRLVLASPARWPSVARHGNGAVCRAAAVNFLGRLVARFSPAWAIVVAPVVSTLGGARAASRAPAAVSVSACLRGSQAVSRACRQCHAAARLMWRLPLVPTVTAAHGPLVAPKVSTRHGQWPGTCSWCILHGGIRVGPGQVVVSPSRSLRNVRLTILLPRGRDRACLARRHGVLHQPSINAHSSDRGVCGAGTT